MAVTLHPFARTTPHTRAELKAEVSGLSHHALARRYGVTAHAVRKWRERGSTAELSHRPHTLHCTLNAAQEAVAMETRWPRAIRRRLWLPMDDLLVAMFELPARRQPVNPTVSRSGLARWLRRHELNKRAVEDKDAPMARGHPVFRRTFKDYAPGFIHVDIKYLPQTGWPRAIKPRQPQTNGVAERFNGRISDILASTRFRSRADLQTTMARGHPVTRNEKLYNEHLAQQAHGHQTPLQTIRVWQKSSQSCLLRKPKNQTALDSPSVPCRWDASITFHRAQLERFHVGTEGGSVVCRSDRSTALMQEVEQRRSSCPDREAGGFAPCGSTFRRGRPVASGQCPWAGHTATVKVLGKVRLIQCFERVPAALEFFGYITKRGQSAAATNMSGKSLHVERIVVQSIERLALHFAVRSAFDSAHLERQPPARRCSANDEYAGACARTI